MLTTKKLLKNTQKIKEGDKGEKKPQGKKNILKGSNGGIEKQKTYTENKWLNGKGKSFLFNKHIQCKQYKIPSQKAQVSSLDFKKKNKICVWLSIGDLLQIYRYKEVESKNGKK